VSYECHVQFREVASVISLFECACTKWGEKWWLEDSFYGELEQVFFNFPKYHTLLLFGDFNAKVGGENIFKLTIGNESLHQDSNDIGVRRGKFATSKNLVLSARCSYTETFISTPRSLLMGRLITRLITYS
jgi:hypothetical protein